MYRRAAITVILASVLALIPSAALAANFVWHGTLETHIEFTPENLLQGVNHLTLTPSVMLPGVTLTLGYSDQIKRYVDNFDPFTFTADGFTMSATGPLYSGGPAITATVGSMDVPLPAWMAGSWSYRAMKGLQLSGVPLGPVKAMGFFGWPRPGYSGDGNNYHWYYGGQLDATLGPVATTVWALHDAMLDGGNRIEAANGQSRTFDGTNTVRLANQLILYTPKMGPRTGQNMWGTEVAIVDNKVVDIRYQPAPDDQGMPIPPNGYVVSGNGSAEAWLRENFHVGDTVKLVLPPTSIPPEVKGETTVGVQANGTFGPAKTGLFVASNIRTAVKTDPVHHEAYKLTASYDIPMPGLVAPLTVSTGAHKVDKEFAPTGATTAADLPPNELDVWRGTTGGNVGLATKVGTSALPVSVSVNYGLTRDDVADTHPLTHRLTLSSGATVSGLALNASVTTIKRTGTAASRTIVGLAASKTVDLWALKGVTLNVGVGPEIPGVTLSSAAGPEILDVGTALDMAASPTLPDMIYPAYTAGFAYTAPNGLSVKGQYTLPNDTTKTGDTCLQVGYTTSF